MCGLENKCQACWWIWWWCLYLARLLNYRNHKRIAVDKWKKGTFLEKSIRIMVQKKGEMDSIKKVNDDHDDRRKLMVCFYTW